MSTRAHAGVMKSLSNRFRVMVAPFGKFTLKSIESFSWKGQIIYCAEYASIKLFYLNTIQALKASLMTFSNCSPHYSLHSSHTGLSPIAWTHQLHVYLRALALTAPCSWNYIPLGIHTASSLHPDLYSEVAKSESPFLITLPKGALLTTLSL